MEEIQDSLRVASECLIVCLQMSPKGCVPLGTYRVEETKGFIHEGYGDSWVARSCNADDLNGALKAMLCIQYHVTPMRSYMVRSGQSRV